MSVAFVTSRGAFVVDLFLKAAPTHCFNIIKLCKLGYFNNSVFLEILSGYFIRVGHPECPDGTTIYSLLSNDRMFFVPDEPMPHLKHSRPGLLSTCNEGPNLNTSNFLITLGGNLSRHDGKHTIFGNISENFEVVLEIAREPIDETGRPYRNIRITYTRILDDPFPDPPMFDILS
jgi:peptidyl-prolyl cis-trans isomerase-like 4